MLVALETQSQEALVPNDGRLQLQVVVTSNTHFNVVPSVGAVQVSPSSGSSIGHVAAFEELPPLDEVLPPLPPALFPEPPPPLILPPVAVIPPVFEPPVGNGMFGPGTISGGSGSSAHAESPTIPPTTAKRPRFKGRIGGTDASRQAGLDQGSVARTREDRQPHLGTWAELPVQPGTPAQGPTGRGLAHSAIGAHSSSGPIVKLLASLHSSTLSRGSATP